MADINITRQHGMTFGDARKAAFKWAEQAEAKFDMECSYEEGKTTDVCGFTRSGVSGTLTVDKETFVLTAKLGFLLGAFKDKIEGEIIKNLDALIAGKTPAAKKVVANKVAKKV
ncbi:MAG: polyhydroxyalkanoic acid system family protein [Vitreoscilla sp.]|nr:polyhydroxyalkanoic acid system family protein [Polaromonas sp.]